jgi:hypothetical protein
MDFDFTLETITPAGSALLGVGNTAGTTVAIGTTLERPAVPINGVIRYNTDGPNFEGYENGSWITFSGINNVNSARYNSLTNSQTAANPGNGRVKWNNSTQINSTQIYMSSITQDGVDITQFLLKVAIGSILWIQISNDSKRYQRWQLDAITNNTGWFTFNVTLLDSLNAQYNNNTSLVVAITSTGTGVVNTFSAGTTGFTPNTATTGNVTLAGTLATTNGGTGLTSTGTANQILGVNTAGTALEYKTITAGGGIIVTPAAGAITVSTRNSLAPTSVIYVSKAGNDTTGNGSWDNPFLTVVKGCTVAATLANPTTQVTVFVINGIYSETNPIAISNENVMVQGQDVGSVFIQPITNGQPLFNLSSGTAGTGPTLNYLTVRGPAGYSAVAGGSLVRVSGDGYFELVNVYADNGYTAVDCGYGTISVGQIVEWIGGDADGNNITVNATSSAQVWTQNTTIRGSTLLAIQAAGTSSIVLNGFLLQGNLTSPTGTGISLFQSANLLATAGQIKGFTTGLFAGGTSNSRLLSTYFANNTNDFNQSTSTAIVQIAGVFSKTAQLITNGSNVSLNYIDSTSNDYIVGSAVSTGVPGKEFRVRNYDGRIAVGDNATDANIASGGVGGSRTINLIDTNGNFRAWRYTNDPATDPSIELIKGINPANADSDGQAPITSITAATDTILISVAGAAFNPPLSATPGIDRTTLAARAFPAGRTFQVIGTASNNGTFTVVSSTYNSGPQTISIVVTTNITVSEGAVGTVVFGGGAGRTDGPNPNNAAAAVAAGTGNVWWDWFLQESDYMVFRRRTGGGGSITNEKVRIYPDHSEWLGASTYSDSDNALIFTAQNTAGAVNYLTLQNSVTTSPVLINAAGTDTDVSISLVPKGAGVVTAGGTRGLVAPSGTTGQQPATPVNGTIRYNTTTSLMEFRQNGVWVNISASAGTVTSVSSSSTTNGLTLTTSNPTTTPSIVLAGTLAATSGGTGQTVYAIGDLLYASTTTALSRLADVATGNALISGGVGVAPSWGKIGLTTHVTGTLPIANGGTNLTTLGTANQILGVNTGATGLEYKTVTAGTGITITPAAGSITIASTVTGTVTSVGLALPSIFTISGSPVITTGTLTGTLATQANNLVFAGPISGGPLAPTFRALSLIGNDLSDVVITSPLANQVLAYNSGTSKWINTGAVGANATGTVGVSPTGGGTAWTLISGSSYRADFVHNLGTTNVVVTLWDTSNNAVVIANSLVTTDANTVRLTVTGNTKTIKVVVVANGQSIVAGGSTPSSIITAQEGVTISAAATKLNFTGQAVKITDAGAGTTNVSIGSRFTFFANSLDSPNNADYAINALAPVTTDPTYTSLNVRSFSNTVEQGVACLISIPSGATQLIVKIRGRAQTAPGVASVVQPRLYYRLLPNNSAVGAWSAAQELANIAIPTNANFQYATQTILLSTLGLTSGNLYQFEFTRRIAGVTGTNLAANFLMAEITLELA